MNMMTPLEESLLERNCEQDTPLLCETKCKLSEESIKHAVDADKDVEKLFVKPNIAEPHLFSERVDTTNDPGYPNTMHREDLLLIPQANDIKLLPDEKILIHTTPLYGGEGGQPFDDGWKNGTIASISIRHGSLINSIAVNYGHMVTCSHGGGGGAEVDSTVVLQEGEYLTAIDAWYGTAMNCLTFHSNVGNKFGPFGLPNGKKVTFHVPSGHMLAGFSGRAETHIDAFAFHFRPIYADDTSSTSDDISGVATQHAKEGGNYNWCTASDAHELVTEVVDAVRDVLSSFFTLNVQLSAEDSPLSSELKVYEQALVNLLRSAQRCLCVPSSREPGFNDLDFRRGFLDCMTQSLNKVETHLQRIDSWKFGCFCLLSKVQNSQMIALKSELAKLDVIVLELMGIEMFVFGESVHIKHPVLRLAWALADAADRNESYLERDLFVNNLMALLQHEIGDAALTRMETFWKDCVTTFVSRLLDPGCDVLFVADLNTKCKLPPLEHRFSFPALRDSVRQMLVESEFSSERRAWKDAQEETVTIKRTTLASVEESKRLCTFIVPQLESFLGADVWAAVETYDTKRDGLAVVQYQVCDRPPQDAVWFFESTSVKFTIGSSAAQPGDEIKILIAGPLVKNNSPIRLRVLQACAVSLVCGTHGSTDYEHKLGSSDTVEQCIAIEHCFWRTPILDWSLINTLQGLATKTSLHWEWRVHCYIYALASIRKSIQHLTDVVEMPWPSSWLQNNLRVIFELLNVRLKVYNGAFQLSANCSRLEDELKSQFNEVDWIDHLLTDLVGSICGTAIRIHHPVLRHAWMLAGDNQRNVSKMERWVLAQNLLTLLGHELGDDAPTNFAPWEPKIISLVSVLGDKGNPSVLTEDLNSVCPGPLLLERSVTKMLEKSSSVSWASSPSMDRRAIIQQEVEWKPVLNLLGEVISKVGELQSRLCVQLNLQSNNDVLVLWLRTCWRVSMVLDLLPEQVLDDVHGILILTMLVLEASCKSAKEMRAAVLQQRLGTQILKEQLSQLKWIVQRMLRTEQSAFGTAKTLRHPVLQRMWALVGADRLHTGSMPRVLAKEILLALLQHEIGGAAFERSEAIWKGCTASFLSKLGDREDDKVSVSDLKRVGNMQLPGNHSVRQMLVESEFSYDTELVGWRGDKEGEHLLVKRTTLPLARDLQTSSTAGSVYESFRAKFTIPQLEVFIGVDVSVDVELKDSKVVGLAAMQYQVGDGPSQFGCLAWCKSSTCGFTIGSAAAKPGDTIKILITWPIITGLLVSVGCVKASAICIYEPESCVGSK